MSDKTSHNDEDIGHVVGTPKSVHHLDCLLYGHDTGLLETRPPDLSARDRGTPRAHGFSQDYLYWDVGW